MKAEAQFGMQTAVGRRHRTNEDALGSDADRGLWLIADGMGGHAAGDVASAIVRDTILEQMAEHPDLPTAVDLAHLAVVEAAAADEAQRGMGSTIVAARIEDGEAKVAWVGDSRAYLLRSGSLKRLTRDHSLVQWLLDQKSITPDEAAKHPERNVLVRTLGFEHPSADIASIALEADDLLLLCSDGVTGMLSETEIREILLANADPQVAADKLIATVVDRQGQDDASAIVIRHHVRDKLSAQPWLPIAGGIGLGVLGYLIWNWMKAS